MNISVLERNAAGSKGGRYGKALLSSVYPKVVPRYVEEFRESDMNLDFAGAAWNRFEMEAVHLERIPSIEGQLTVGRDIADSRDKPGAGMDDAEEN